MPSSKLVKETPVYSTLNISLHSTFTGCIVVMPAEVGERRAPMADAAPIPSFQFSFVWTAICVNYDPAASKTQQTSAHWLAHKFTRNLTAHHPLCCLWSNRNNKRPILPGLFQVPEAMTNRCLRWCNLSVLIVAAIKALKVFRRTQSRRFRSSQ